MHAVARPPADFRLILHDHLSDSYELSKVLLAKASFDGRGTAAAVAAILDTLDMRPVMLRMRCRDGLGKCLRWHRLYDAQERMMYIVAEEAAADRVRDIGGGDRRAAVRGA